MQSEAALEVFKAHLKQNGQRFTNERKHILDAVLQAREHFSAETLVQRLRRGHKRVSLATVYRTLPVLMECGFLQSTVKQGDVDFFERKLGENHHHDHLLCVRCGKIVEFMNATIEREQEKVAEMNGFKLETHRLELRGKCSQCR